MDKPTQADMKPVAWRWRYLHPGKINHWTLRASEIVPIEPHPGFVGIEVEPLYRLSTPTSEADDLDHRGHSAYEQGYRDGFVDARFPEGHPGDEREVYRDIDTVAIADGWRQYLDTLPPSAPSRAACRHGAIPPESCLQRETRGCPEGDAATLKAPK